MNSAVIVAAGRGTRMGPGIDKLFLEVAGLPVVAHTWRAADASPAIDEVVLVVREGHQAAFADLARTLLPDLTKPWRTVPGGAERQDSVWNGVESLADPQGLVAIQDGARPCTPPGLFDRCLEAARRTGASVAARPSVDTIKESADGLHISGHPDRSRLWTVQTPQCFRVDVIRRALAAVRRQGAVVTDDTAACGWIGQEVELVPDAAPNPKVTTADDLPYVEFLLRGACSGQP